MIEVGRLCVKTAGREAGLKAVVVDIVDETFVLIDGQVKRKRCNVVHLEPLKEKIAIKKGASHADVVKEFKKLKIEIKEKKARKPKKEKPVKQRKKKEKVEEAEKKVEKKSEEKPKVVEKKVLKK